MTEVKGNLWMATLVRKISRSQDFSTLVTFELRHERWKLVRLSRIWEKSISDWWKSKTKCAEGQAGQVQKTERRSVSLLHKMPGKETLGLRSKGWRRFNYAGPQASQHAFCVLFQDQEETLKHFRQVETFDLCFKKLLWQPVKLVLLHLLSDRITWGSY